jgi:hypothetical protein
MKDMQQAGVAPAPRQAQVPPVAAIHPMFAKKLEEVAKDEQERKKAEGWMPVWDDLRTLYIECAKGVMAPAVLGALARRKDIITYIRDQKGLQLRIQMFTRDILTLKNELSAIAAEHVNREGGTSDPDELMLSIQIAEKYNLFKERMTAIIEPTVAHIFEIFTEAELLMLDAQGQLSDTGLKPEQDPTVVTDVEVIETTMTAAGNAVQEINA